MSQDTNDVVYQARLHWMLYLPTIQLAGWSIVFFIIAYFFDLPNMIEHHIHLPWWLVLVAFGLFALSTLKSFLSQTIVFLTTNVYLTKHKVHLKAGLFNVQQMELPLNQIESTSVAQDFWGSMFGYGSITFYGTGGRCPETFWIINPQAFTQKLSELQEEARR